MAASEQAKVYLSPEDLEDALKVLSDQERAGADEQRRSALAIVTYVAFALLLFGCSLGLVIVWFDRVWGWGLLAAGFVGVVLFIATMRRTIERDRQAHALERAIQESSLGQAVSEAWDRRSKRWYLSAACLVIVVGGLAGLIGLGLLIYGLVTTGQVNPWSLVLVGLPIVTMFVYSAIDTNRKVSYYTQVSQVRGDLESHLEKAYDEGTKEATVSSAVYELLSQAEAKQAHFEAVQAMQEVVEEEPSYYVRRDPDASEAIRGIPPEEREAVYDAMDALLVDPHSPGARALAGEAEPRYEIDAGSYTIVYAVDEDRRLVRISEVRRTTPGEVPDAS